MFQLKNTIFYNPITFPHTSSKPSLLSNLHCLDLHVRNIKAVGAAQCASTCSSLAPSTSAAPVRPHRRAPGRPRPVASLSPTDSTAPSTPHLHLPSHAEVCGIDFKVFSSPFLLRLKATREQADIARPLRACAAIPGNQEGLGKKYFANWYHLQI